MSVKPAFTITDPTLLSFHNQHVLTFRGTEQQVTRILLELESVKKGIEPFAAKVRARGKELQERVSTVGEGVELKPSDLDLPELTAERDAFLAQFEAYKLAYKKVALLTQNIQQNINFLTPVYAEWKEDAALKKSAPELYEQTKYIEACALEFIVQLKAYNTQVIGLRDVLGEAINDATLTWSLQRICQIIDNGGKPLGLYARTVNYWTTPVVPTLQELNK
jgi:hypothetical protein